MISVDDVIRDWQIQNVEPSDADLRKLPLREAIIYPRLSSKIQLRESRESMLEIVELLRLAKQDGYRSALTPTDVEEQVFNIQNGRDHKEVLTEGEITIDFRDLGISGRLSSDDRPALKALQEFVAEGRVGAVYVSEPSRLTRDQRRITPYFLLELFSQNSCRVRTPEYISNPRISRDWEHLRDEFEDGIEEIKVFARRMGRKKKQKAKRGEYVGEPVPPGFIVEIKETESSGRLILGKYQRYLPHAEIDAIVLSKYIEQGFSEMKTIKALKGLVYPLFPAELSYMEQRSSLRTTTKIEGVGYLLTPSMISSLARNPKMIGMWTFKGIQPILDNHEGAVPLDLWLEAHEGYKRAVKPRGRGMKRQPLEWDDLLKCCNHDVPKRISGHSTKGAYRCDSDYRLGRGPSCLDITSRHIDEKLTPVILRQLDFTSFSEEVLARLEADSSHISLEEEQRKKQTAELERRFASLGARLGWNGGSLDQILLEQIERTQAELIGLRARPVPTSPIPVTNYRVVRDFLAGLSKKWYTYPRALRNRLLRLLIDRVDIHHEGKILEATVHWKTGQIELIIIPRARAKRNPELAWTEEERNLVHRMWSDTPQQEIVSALPGRTWKAIAHEAERQGLRRAPAPPRKTRRIRWQFEEEREAKRQYESGTPILDIAVKHERSCGAVLQRAWAGSWRRPDSNKTPVSPKSPIQKQTPVVSKGISSGRGVRGNG